MAPGHRELFKNLNAAVRGEKGARETEGEGGSLNYVGMRLVTAWIVRPTNETEDELVEFFDRQKTAGHRTRVGRKGTVTECGSPGMHGQFNGGAEAGALLHGLRRKNPRMIKAAGTRVQADAIFNREFLWKGHVIVPSSRMKDDEEGAARSPVDGYRDFNTGMLLGRQVPNKPAKFWDNPQALACWALREVIRENPGFSWWDPSAGMPFVAFLPRKIAVDGGFFAYIEDTPAARPVFGGDCCNWVLVSDKIAAESRYLDARQCVELDGGTVTWGYDWEPFPNSVKGAV